MKRRNRRALSQINVVPYIDVMLVLLVIFMVTTPLLSQGVTVNLPNAHAKAIQSKQQPIIVTVDAQGNYYLNIANNPDLPMTANQLALRVAAQMAIEKQGKQSQFQVYVKGDKNVDYGKVVQAMVLLQQAGVTQIGLLTQDNQTTKQA